MSLIRRIVHATGALLLRAGERLTRWGPAEETVEPESRDDPAAVESIEGPPAHWVEMIRAKAPWLLDGDQLLADSVTLPRISRSRPMAEAGHLEAEVEEPKPEPARPTRPNEPSADRRDAPSSRSNAKPALGRLGAASPKKEVEHGGGAPPEKGGQRDSRLARLSAPSERPPEKIVDQPVETEPDQPVAPTPKVVARGADPDSSSFSNEAVHREVRPATSWTTFGEPRADGGSTPSASRSLERRSIARPGSTAAGSLSDSTQAPGPASGGALGSPVERIMPISRWPADDTRVVERQRSQPSEPFPEDDDRWPALPDNQLDLWQTELIQYHHQQRAEKRLERLTAEQAGSSWSGPPF